MFCGHSPKVGNSSRAPQSAGEISQNVTAGTATGIPSSSSRHHVRKSIGEWEAGKPDTLLTITPPKRTLKAVAPPKSKPITSSRQSVETTGSPPKKVPPKSSDRVAEARAWVTKAKIQLGKSGNIKREIKEEVTEAIDRLYQLVKEAELSKRPLRQNETESLSPPHSSVLEESKMCDNSEIKCLIRQHIELLKDSSEKTRALTDALNQRAVPEEHAKAQSEGMEKLLSEVREIRLTAESKTYASAVAAPPKKILPVQTPLHSVIVTAKDELETGEEVLERIRKTVNAKDGGVTVDRVRKAKDAKVIVTCRSVEERQKLKDRLSKSNELNVEEIRNKDPLVILRDVFLYNSDEDVLRALKNQNKSLFANLKMEDQRCDIAFKKRTRNPHTSHIVMRVSPQLWQAMVVAETVHIDLQRVRVADHSPLVQCSLCLGYGHGRRFCKESLEKCSHCGGPHLKVKCAEWLANATPSCCNCVLAKLDKSDHNAFSDECAIRRKWEALARATVAYC